MSCLVLHSLLISSLFSHIISLLFFFFFNDTAPTEIYTLSLHDALPIYDILEARPLRIHFNGRIHKVRLRLSRRHRNRARRRVRSADLLQRRRGRRRQTVERLTRPHPSEPARVEPVRRALPRPPRQTAVA